MQAAYISGDELIDWCDADALLVGLPQGDASVSARVGVVLDGGSRLRIDLQASAGSSCFHEVRCVNGIVYIGFGEYVFVFWPDSREFDAHPLLGYFGHLCTAAELEASEQDFAVLVGSASELLCFSRDGALQWRASNLGIDGVIPHSVQEGVVTGAGEWDPPDGWEQFKVSLSTGDKIVS